jgi:hypothetical protein
MNVSEMGRTRRGECLPLAVRLIAAIALVVLAADAAITRAGAPDDADSQPDPQTGISLAPEPYTIGNFSMTASISDDGLRIRKLLFNPPVLGQWLKPVGHGDLKLIVGGGETFVVTARQTVFPESVVGLRSLNTSVEAEVRTFAPISSGSANSSFNSFLPAIIVQVTLTNRGADSQRVDASYVVTPEKPNSVIGAGKVTFGGRDMPEVFQRTGRSQVWLLGLSDSGGSTFAWQTPPPDEINNGTMTLEAAGTLKPGESAGVLWVVGIYDHREYTAKQLSSRAALQRYLLQQGLQDTPGSLQRQTHDFIASLPRTGDADIDLYLRWYLSPAILLTRGTAAGEVLTMGYAELNQRDSFWTSGAHLIYWPDLELKMLHESMSHQHPDGQVPMTILPTIDRAHNIDGNEYFVLRIARYYQWVRDDAFLKEAMPHVKKAIDYLITQDTDHVGMPKQTGYWGDWKDVPGVEGRLYAPHFDLLWLATLKNARALAQEAGDTSYERLLAILYERAAERINRHVSQGGLWNGNCYVDVWRDGRQSEYTLQDQTVAAIWGVIPHERLERIYTTLNSSNESRFGVRETYPYITSKFDQMDYGMAEYHNGGIWPWLNFADAWGRFLNGRAADAERILKEVGEQQLVRSHRYSPGEFLNGETGKTEGFPIQGWNADILSTIYFGAFGLERRSAEDLVVHLNLTGKNDLTTTIRVPEGTLLLTRRDGRVSIVKQFEKPLNTILTQ